MKTPPKDTKNIKSEANSGEESTDKLNELKISLLKQVQKRRAIRKELARLLTFKNKKNRRSR